MIAGRVFSRVPAVSLTAALAIGIVSAGVSAVRAGDCNADIAALSAKRQTYIAKLNDLAKASKGKLDPVASCPQLQGLVKAEGALLTYLQANMTWCNIPDETVANLRAGSAKSAGFAKQACDFAARAKEQQKQQVETGNALAAQAQKLPTGPL